MRPTVTDLQAAGPVVEELAAEYAESPVLFLEQDVDRPLGHRIDRWWKAHGSSASVYLPLVMADSGAVFSNGYEDFHDVYSAMVDESSRGRPERR